MASGGRARWWVGVACALTGAVVGTVAVLGGDGRAEGPPAADDRAAVVQPPDRPAVVEPGDRPSVTFLGDSWAQGVGATGLRGFPVMTAEQLQWDSAVLAVGGSGYVAPGPEVTYGVRIDAAVATRADVIVVQGSINDRAVPVGELAPAVVETLARLRRTADPTTEIVVLGASHTPGTDAAAVDRINGAVSAGARTVGVRFVDVAAENWTDPADPSVWADPSHPNDRGHQGIADRLANVLKVDELLARH